MTTELGTITDSNDSTHSLEIYRGMGGLCLWTSYGGSLGIKFWLNRASAEKLFHILEDELAFGKAFADEEPRRK